jgi:hypothetical protein
MARHIHKRDKPSGCRGFSLLLSFYKRFHITEIIGTGRRHTEREIAE